MKTELSKKQEKVLKLYLAGYGPKKIGELMYLSINTVCSYKSIVMEKWEVENNVELIIEAVRRGYVDFEDEEEIQPINFVYSNHSLSHDTFVYYGATRRMYTYTHLIKE